MTGWAFALPEIFLASAGLVALLASAFGGKKSAGAVRTLAVLSFLLTAGFVACAGADGLAFGGMLVMDPLGRFAKILTLVAAALALGMGGEKNRADYAVLALFATLGMALMISANDLIALYVGLELQNLALYVLASFRREDRRASEAGMKYFTLGALSSAILLFGLSFLYGLAGTTSYEGLGLFMAQSQTVPPGLAVGLVFTLAGLAFKISAAPFHMWAPDVYEGAPTPVTAFLAAVPKIAALILIVRLLGGPFAGALAVWQPLVVFFAVLSMFWGGFAGLAQTNVKRLMAYSGVINMGTLLIGLAAFKGGAAAGIEGLLLYLAVYVPGVLAVFGVLLSLRREGKEAVKVADLAGLSKTHPALALAMGAALFSLAGIPPFAGFFGKYLVLLAAVKAETTSLAILGVTASVVAAGYYLRIVKVMYFDPPGEVSLEEVPEKPLRFVVVLTALAVTFFVLIPAPLMGVAQKTAESFLKP